MNQEYILAIDPAGIGVTGVVICDVQDLSIIEHFYFKSTSWQEAISNFATIISKFNNDFFQQNNVSFVPKYIILEDYELWNYSKLTQPTATAKVVGGFMTLLIYYFKWQKPILQKPNCKKKFTYEGSIRLNSDEQDAWKHIQYFLLRKNIVDSC